MLIDLNNVDEVETSTSAATGFRRSTKNRQIPSALHDFEVVSDSSVDSERELVHYTLFAEFDSINVMKQCATPNG